MAIYYNKNNCNSPQLCYNIDIMKKSLTIILVIILLLTTTLALVGCKQSFGAKNVREQIESNLGWHTGGNETCVYDVFDGEVNVGTYVSKMSYVYNKTVTITTSNEEQNRTIENFSGYKFETEMSATADGKTYERRSVSYTDLNLAPKLCYVQEKLDSSVETITSYDAKRINATFIVDGAVSDDSVKYKTALMNYDNSYIYQFARTTDLTSTLSINVATYSVSSESQKVSKSTFGVTYLANMTASVDNQFLLDKEVAEGESNLTSAIPSYCCTFTSTNSSLVRGTISCYISAYPLKMQDGDKFASRAVVMIKEGKMTYKLKSIEYSYSINA